MGVTGPGGGLAASEAQVFPSVGSPWHSNAGLDVEETPFN